MYRRLLNRDCKQAETSWVNFSSWTRLELEIERSLALLEIILQLTEPELHVLEPGSVARLWAPARIGLSAERRAQLGCPTGPSPSRLGSYLRAQVWLLIIFFKKNSKPTWEESPMGWTQRLYRSLEKRERALSLIFLYFKKKTISNYINKSTSKELFTPNTHSLIKSQLLILYLRKFILYLTKLWTLKEESMHFRVHAVLRVLEICKRICGGS